LAIDVAVRRDAWRPRRIQGIGGLGHLGVQFANKFGYKVAAIGRGVETAALVKKLGASVYIDSKATNPAQELQRLGGAQVIFGDGSRFESDVGDDRWFGAERKVGGDRGDIRSH